MNKNIFVLLHEEEGCKLVATEYMYMKREVADGG